MRDSSSLCRKLDAPNATPHSFVALEAAHALCVTERSPLQSFFPQLQPVIEARLEATQKERKLSATGAQPPVTSTAAQLERADLPGKERLFYRAPARPKDENCSTEPVAAVQNETPSAEETAVKHKLNATNN